MSKARLIVDLDIKSEEIDSFVKMFRSEFVSRSRGEEGCEFYELWQDPKSPSKMTIVEIWSNQAALDKHLAQSWFAEWAPRMESALATPLVVRSLRSAED